VGCQERGHPGGACAGQERVEVLAIDGLPVGGIRDFDPPGKTGFWITRCAMDYYDLTLRVIYPDPLSAGFLMPNIVALVPMRHHSQRVPGKNYRPLAGKPLFHHILETLLAVPEIEQVVVDTDSEPVMDGLRRDFPQVTIINRPKALRADDVPMNDILLHDTGQVQADFYLQTHSTNPFVAVRNGLTRH
jgi:hypothetical protein